MASMEEFQRNLLRYLYVEEALAIKELEQQSLMSEEEKVEKGLLLTNAVVVGREGDFYDIAVPENFSKFRAGDRVDVHDNQNQSAYSAKIVDIYQDTITVECSAELSKDRIYSIENQNPELLKSLISCLEGIYAGVPGASFLRLLAKEIPIEIEEFLRVELDKVPNIQSVIKNIDTDQRQAIEKMLEYPPIHVLQGPPGTGKTKVLAITAIATARMNREVVVIANTHHAVNNALQKIKALDPNATIVKIGEKLKSEELDDKILKFEKFSEYLDYSYRNRKIKKTGHIVGITIWGAITNLGLRRHSHFRPYVSLVDEASLMPISLASILGKTAPSVCLFGDSRQMKPIFRSELESHPMSVSILDYCAQEVVGIPISILHTTYRMNESITNMVSKNFYEPFGIKLISSDFSKNKILKLPYFEESGLVGSISSIIIENEGLESKDCNSKEASRVGMIVQKILSDGLSPRELAVVSPFRKQVRIIKDAVRELIGDVPELLIDTVERLQGQDVECVILSFASSDPEYIHNLREFLFNSNRLNVMVSRAKTKVILVVSSSLAKIMWNYKVSEKNCGKYSRRGKFEEYGSPMYINIDNVHFYGNGNLIKSEGDIKINKVFNLS